MAARSLVANSVASLWVGFDSALKPDEADTASVEESEVLSVTNSGFKSLSDTESSKVSISLSATIRSPLEAVGLFHSSH